MLRCTGLWPDSFTLEEILSYEYLNNLSTTFRFACTVQCPREVSFAHYRVKFPFDKKSCEIRRSSRLPFTKHKMVRLEMYSISKQVKKLCTLLIEPLIPIKSCNGNGARRLIRRSTPSWNHPPLILNRNFKLLSAPVCELHSSNRYRCTR